jgi:hypothetical protein
MLGGPYRHDCPLAFPEKSIVRLGSAPSFMGRPMEVGLVLQHDAALLMVTPRGFAGYPKTQATGRVYVSRTVALAVYPM